MDFAKMTRSLAAVINVTYLMIIKGGFSASFLI